MDAYTGKKATAVTRPQGVLPVGGRAATLALGVFQQSRNRNRLVSSPPSVRSHSEARSQYQRSFHVSHSPSIFNLLHASPTSTAPPPEHIQHLINNAPGNVDHRPTDGDDDDDDVADRYNFYAHGKRYLFATTSLWYFDETSAFRRRVVWLTTSRAFEQLVLALIFANSILLALPDLSHVDANGELETTGSLRNAVVTTADAVFTALFAVECSLKIVAMGLAGERGAYLMDPWNWIDFVVVFVGLLAVAPGMPNVSGLRALRVLRPLRFLNAVPGIKKLVTALLRSIPELLSVVAFLSFLFFLYGVVGVQLWTGVLHARCRLTPFPVALDPRLTLEELPAYQARVVANASAFRCRGDPNGPGLAVDDDAWTFASSPWHTPRVCYWPVADSGADAQTCNLAFGDSTSSNAARSCPAAQTCGSDYDFYGNFRFTHPDARVRRVLLHTASYTPNLNYGVTSFDSIGSAALILFVCMPREGWSDIMYALQDAGYGTAAPVYFISFVLFGSFFMLNLALAVIWENFSDQSFLEAEEERIKEGTRFASLAHLPPVPPSRSARIAGVPIVRAVVGHWASDLVRTVLILLNTVILSLDQYPEDEALSRVVDTVNFLLAVAFTVDAALKMVGLGFAAWRADGYNIFDACVVVVSLTEVGLSPPQWISGRSLQQASNAFSGLRSVRIFMLFKLARFWPSLQKLLSTIVSTIHEIGNFSVLLLLFMYIYALLGMQVFGNRFRFDEYGYPLDPTSLEPASYVPRANFDTILWSMVTIFQILTGENWTSVLIDGWRSTGWACVFYFLSLVVLGNFILLNLFLAILLGNFEDQQDDVERLAIEKDELRRKSRVLPSRSSIGGSSDQSSAKSRRRESTMKSRKTSRSLPTHGSLKSIVAVGSGAGAGKSGGTATTAPMSALALAAMNQKSAKTVLTPEQTRPRNPTGTALCLFGPRHWLRRNAWAITHHPHFDRILLVLVLTSTVAVVLDNPLTAPQSLLPYVLSWGDLVLTSLFVVEIVLKVVAHGLFFSADAYLRNYWNVMDFVITLVSVVGLQADGTHWKFLTTLRTFRALRPLRLINRNAGMKLVVSSLFAAIPQIVNVLMVVLLMLTIFSILAVNSLKGKFFSCLGPAFDALSGAQQQLIASPRAWRALTAAEQLWFTDRNTSALYEDASSAGTMPTSRLVCGWLGAAWSRTIPQNFDNVLLGWRTFFEISTTEGWVTLMLASVDATEIDMQPIVNHREWWTLFFIVFIFCGSFFVVQLFIGVVIENFNRMKEKLDGTFLLSSSQREWLMISEAMLNMRPFRKLRTPRHRLRRLCFRAAHSETLETLAIGAILLNTFLMALHYFGEDDLYRAVLDYANYFFACAFTLEAGIKILGLGRYYWKESWNVFDFGVVVGSFLGMVYTWSSGDEVGASAATIRSFRVARLIKLLQTWPSLRQLANTLLITLPSLVSIGGLLFLVLFIYAALGVQLFAKVKMGQLVTPGTNFQSLSRAMVTLMRCATGERWNDLMHELASTDDCVDDPEFDPHMCGFSDRADSDCVPLNGCGTPVAYVYFCSFTMLVTFVLLNILIAVILEGFANEKDRANGVLVPQQYENFVTTWSAFDPDATGYLEWHELPRFLQELDEPLGFGTQYEASRKEMQAFIKYLDVAIYGGNKVYFYDVARKLGKFVLDVVNGVSVEDLPANIEVDQKWRTLLKGTKLRKIERATHRLNHMQAALVLHEAVTSAVFRDELKARVLKFTHLTSSILSAPSTPHQRSPGKRKSSHRKNSAKADLSSRHSQYD